LTVVSALILAGGRRRLGSDRAATMWDGQTFLEEAVDLARGVSDDVIVLTAWSRHDSEQPLVAGTRELHDPEPFPGPLVALTTGLVHVYHDICLVLAADMPAVTARVLTLMVETAAACESHTAVALARDGRAQPLPLVVRARRTYPYLARVVAAGERKLRSVLDMPAIHAIDEVTWRAADRWQESLRDMDTAADYADLLARRTGSPTTLDLTGRRIV
jgi:molybdopterin-guanine dinucleotide biosynthesis protein A